MPNDTDELPQGRTDWRTLITAVGVFYASLTGLGWLHSEYLLGRVDQRITAHSESAGNKRAEFYDAASKRLGQLEQNCAVVQSRIASAESRLDGLDHWHSECGRKMAGVERYIERDADDIQKLETRVDRLEDLVNRGVRK